MHAVLAVSMQSKNREARSSRGNEAVELRSPHVQPRYLGCYTRLHRYGLAWPLFPTSVSEFVKTVRQVVWEVSNFGSEVRPATLNALQQLCSYERERVDLCPRTHVQSTRSRS